MLNANEVTAPPISAFRQAMRVSGTKRKTTAQVNATLAQEKPSCTSCTWSPCQGDEANSRWWKAVSNVREANTASRSGPAASVSTKAKALRCT